MPHGYPRWFKVCADLRKEMCEFLYTRCFEAKFLYTKVDLRRRPLQLRQRLGSRVAPRAQQACVLRRIAVDGPRAVQLRALLRQILLAGGAEAALQLAFLFLQPPPM